ncbi:unnamed protein product [Diamesa serratosioi]
MYGQPTAKTHPHILKPGEIVQGITLEEIKNRRENLMENIKSYSSANYADVKHHLVVIPSAVKKYMSDKIPYVFRQNSDFIYLTGCLEVDSILVMIIGEKDSDCKSILFVRPKDKHAELWDGIRTGQENAIELFGLDEAYSIKEFQRYVDKFKTQGSTLVWYDGKNSDQPDLSPILKNEENENPTKFIHSLRWIKSPAEIELMRTTCKIASKAINHTMKISKPGVLEHHIFANVDYQSRMLGASFLAYPPVVASGKNSTTIHYINNSQVVSNGDMVLLDAGCEYGGYSSDITRTWPVNGNFTDPQRILYEIVLSLQKDLIRTVLNTGGQTLDELFDTMCLQLGHYLQEVNLIPKDKTGYDLARAAYKFCPHHVSHYLGMDVHDTSLVSRSNKLIAGNVFTVEPGIYIPTTNKEVPEEFRGIGLRIEDDVFINEQMKIEILTESCVKEVDGLIKLINEK